MDVERHYASLRAISGGNSPIALFASTQLLLEWNNTVMEHDDTRPVLLEIAELLEAGGEEPFAMMVRGALSGSERTLEQFLISNELWGGAGSIADQPFTGDPHRRKALERLLIRLGKLQMDLGNLNVRTRGWQRLNTGAKSACVNIPSCLLDLESSLEPPRFAPRVVTKPLQRATRYFIGSDDANTRRSQTASLERLVHRPLVESDLLRDLPVGMEQSPVAFACAGAKDTSHAGEPAELSTIDQRILSR
jgi:hypothetical protein